MEQLNELTGEPLGFDIAGVGVVDRVAKGLASSMELDRMYGCWSIALLPHLEQSGLYEKFDLNLPISDPANAEVRRVLQMRCLGLRPSWRSNSTSA